MATGRGVCGPHPKGRETGRSPRGAADDVRAGHQPQDRQGPRPDDPAVALAASGSGNRVIDRWVFIGTLAGGLLAVSLAAEAQTPGRVTKLGILSTVNPRTTTFTEAMVKRLGELGHVEGLNLAIEFRNAQGDVTRLPALAAELVRLNVDVILASGPEVVLQAARKATASVPIVIVAVDFDPIARGYVATLAKPGGNVTGVVLRQIELTGKRMQFAARLSRYPGL